MGYRIQFIEARDGEPDKLGRIIGYVIASFGSAKFEGRYMLSDSEGAANGFIVLDALGHPVYRWRRPKA
jgi:hypothetical protein